MRYILFLNGTLNNIDYVKSIVNDTDKIIAVDGGLNYVYKLNLIPQFILGDLDSVDKNILNHYKDTVELIKYPSEKDFTDLELALEIAKEQGATEIIILSGTGGRIDHYLGNINALAYCVDNNISASLLDEKTRITVIDKNIELKNVKDKTISLIPLTSVVENITTEGLKYSLTNENLYVGKCRGISNEAITNNIKINLSKGKLIIVINY